MPNHCRKDWASNWNGHIEKWALRTDEEGEALTGKKLYRGIRKYRSTDGRGGVKEGRVRGQSRVRTRKKPRFEKLTDTKRIVDGVVKGGSQERTSNRGKRVDSVRRKETRRILETAGGKSTSGRGSNWGLQEFTPKSARQERTVT